MHRTILTFGLSLLSAITLTAQTANPVIQWNRVLLQLLRTPGAQPSTIHPTRTMAMMHTAVFEAVNSIEGEYQPYAQRIPVAVPDASQDAAAHAAAFGILSQLFPASASSLQSTYDQAVAAIPDSPQKSEGIRVGSVAASEIMLLRAADHSADPAPAVTLGTGPGQYQSTPPDNPKPAFTGWSRVQPFALLTSSQFRPGPPPALTSPEYTAGFNEIKTQGAPHSTTASVDEQITGWFWNGPIQNYWNEIAQTAAIAHQLDTNDTALLFAQLNVSFADTVIAFYDAKYVYLFWRPVTAVRAADTDGNPDTIGNPDWLPETQKTAGDPSYPGAHAAISAAAAKILTFFFGSDQFAFSVTSEVFAGFRRNFTTFSAAAQEATLSRIFSGQHFRFDLDAGGTLGQNVAQFVIANLFQPVAE